MMTPPELLLAQGQAYRHEMFADAERSRLLRGALERRRAARSARRRAKAAARKGGDGNLAACGERAPAPAQ